MSPAVILLIFGCVALFWGLAHAHKSLTFRKLLKLLEEGKFDEYYNILEAPLTKFHYPAFNRTFMRLNGLIIQKRYRQVDETFQELLAGKATAQQRHDLVLKAFDYYIGRKNKRMVNQLMSEIAGWDDEKTLRACERLRDILLLDKSNHIEEMEEELERLGPGSARQQQLILIAAQYKNKGDDENADKYRTMAELEMIDAGKK